MFDLERQRKALLARLRYYQTVFINRSAEYRAFKERNSIPRIHAALRRLDDGTYWQCAKCDDEIGEKRLIQVPGALYCVECQEEIEAQNKKRARL